MIALDLLIVHYETLLIIHLRFTKKNAEDAKKEEKSNLYAILLDLKIIKRMRRSMVNQKFPNTHQFCNGDINKFVLLLSPYK